MISLLLLFLNIPTFAQVVIIDDFSNVSSHGYKVKTVLQEDYKGEIITLPVSNYQDSLAQVLKLKPLVLNLSFGTNEYNFEEIELLKKISEQGTFIIVASGNNNQKVNEVNPVYPCFYPVDNLICVGASEKNDKAKFSNYGPKVKVYTSGKFQGQNMTSFSAPRVSAFFANALKCNHQPLELLSLNSIKVANQDNYLINYSADSFCFTSNNKGPR